MAANEKKYKTSRQIVTISKEMHSLLKVIAAANNRSIGGQLDFLIKMAAGTQVN